MQHGVGANAAGASAGDDELRVVSWNVWWRFGPDWRRRQDGIGATLAALRPDVVGLQESWACDGLTQAEVIGDRLGMCSAFAAPSLPPVPDPPESPDQDGCSLGVALLSRWPLEHVRTAALPSTRRSVQPVVLLATVTHPRGPLHVAVSCVEWEPSYAGDHLAQTRALAALLAEPRLAGALPVLLTADLNAAPGTPEIEALTETLVDTWVAGHGDPDAVTLSSGHPSAPREAVKQLDRRIDYVLARPAAGAADVPVVRVGLAGGPVDGLFPSDHYAVVVDLAM